MKGSETDLTPDESAFVERRARLIRAWPVLGAVMLLGVLVFAAWVWISRPLLINPWAVMGGLESGAIPDATLSLLAGLLPVVMISCLFVLMVGIGLAFAAFGNERRLIGIIERLSERRDEGGSGPA